MTTTLVEIVHPLTGKTIRMHPDLVSQKHHWVHPDPSVPTPPESLPLFDMGALETVVKRLLTSRLATQTPVQTTTPDHQRNELQANPA